MAGAKGRSPHYRENIPYCIERREVGGGRALSFLLLEFLAVDTAGQFPLTDKIYLSSETLHRWCQFLPDGNHHPILFRVVRNGEHARGRTGTAIA